MKWIGEQVHPDHMGEMEFWEGIASEIYTEDNGYMVVPVQDRVETPVMLRLAFPSGFPSVKNLINADLSERTA